MHKALLLPKHLVCSLSTGLGSSSSSRQVTISELYYVRGERSVSILCVDFRYWCWNNGFRLPHAWRALHAHFLGPNRAHMKARCLCLETEYARCGSASGIHFKRKNPITQCSCTRLKTVYHILISSYLNLYVYKWMLVCLFTYLW